MIHSEKLVCTDHCCYVSEWGEMPITQWVLAVFFLLPWNYIAKHALPAACDAVTQDQHVQTVHILIIGKSVSWKWPVCGIAPSAHRSSHASKKISKNNLPTWESVLTQGNKHQNCRYTKSKGVAVTPKARYIISQDWCDEGRQERPSINTVSNAKCKTIKTEL